MSETASKRFNILSFVNFCSSQTRSSAYFKLRHSLSRKNYTCHLYFNGLPRLWNSLPYIDIQRSVSTINKKLKDFMLSHFIKNFDPDNACSFHFVCPCVKCTLLPVSCTLTPPSYKLVLVYIICVFYVLACNIALRLLVLKPSVLQHSSFLIHSHSLSVYVLSVL